MHPLHTGLELSFELAANLAASRESNQFSLRPMRWRSVPIPVRFRNSNNPIHACRLWCRCLCFGVSFELQHSPMQSLEWLFLVSPFFFGPLASAFIFLCLLPRRLPSQLSLGAE